ncbi:hypothetical protein diail_1962 [Diaporthe ilicicola]|nr:hypothetical protein diail_1962 [Diaporthe ilicicola]
MKFLAVSALFFAASTQACALYQFCHCTSADGTPDDIATLTACMAQSESDKEFTGISGFQECHFYGDAHSGFADLEKNGLDNCDFREACTAAGATGQDSSCSGKLH